MRKEPFEELMCVVEEDHTGAVIEAVTLRKGEVRRRRAGSPLDHVLMLFTTTRRATGACCPCTPDGSGDIAPTRGSSPTGCRRF